MQCFAKTVISIGNLFNAIRKLCHRLLIYFSMQFHFVETLFVIKPFSDEFFLMLLRNE